MNPMKQQNKNKGKIRWIDKNETMMAYLQNALIFNKDYDGAE